MVRTDDASSRYGGRDSTASRRSLPRIPFFTTFTTQHRPQEHLDKEPSRRHHQHQNHHPNYHRHPQHHRRDHHEQAAQEEARIEIKVRDLDAHRQDVTFGVRPGVSISKVDTKLRDQASKVPIPDETLVLFYRDGRELRPGSVVREAGVIFYRVLSGSDDGSLRIRWHGHDQRGDHLDTVFTEGLVREIERGATLGDVRRKLAAQLQVDDANRVAITAWGGVRPGLLEGDSWETRQIRLWLCRCLNVEVRPRDRYLVVKGLRRDYLYHPTSSSSPHAVVRFVKTWIHNRLLTGVHQHGSTKVDIRTRDIVLEHDGSAVEGFAELPWGSTVQFSLKSADAAEAFSGEESFLLPATETCSVCCDDRPVSAFPVRITAACDHVPDLCKPCLQQWLASSLESLTWDRLKCPSCPELLQYEDVRRFASADVFARYDDLATRDALKDMRGFRWCLDAKCSSGQIHDATCPIFKCRACRARHCVAHEVPWHRGETCDEYDRRNRRRRKDERKSERTVKEISKRCPECRRDVHKYSGCNHITCVCGHEWCYICFAPFRTTPQGFLRCQHNSGCTERDIFADLEDLPGGFMPPPLQPGQRPRPPRPPPGWEGFFGDRMPPPPPPPRRMPQAPPGRAGFVPDDNPFRPLTPPPPPPPPPPPAFGPHRRPWPVEIVEEVDVDDDDIAIGASDVDDEEGDSQVEEEGSSGSDADMADDADGEDSDLDRVPPAAPPPPRFAGTPPPVREEIAARRRRQEAAVMEFFAATQAMARARTRNREAAFMREMARGRAW